MTNDCSTLALIPARAGSKGIPHKNIRPLGDVPLIGHACNSARGSRVDRIVVTTDCLSIAEVARAHGAETPFLRPPDLGRDESPMVNVIHHALTWLASHQAIAPEIVVLLQPTNPFRTANDIDTAIARLRSSGADSVVSVCRVPTHYNADWQFFEDQGEMQLASGLPLEHIITRRQCLRPTYIRNGAIYAFRADMFLRSRNLYGSRCIGYEMPPSRSINVDTMEDWEAAERSLRERQRLSVEVELREAA